MPLFDLYRNNPSTAYCPGSQRDQHTLSFLTDRCTSYTGSKLPEDRTSALAEQPPSRIPFPHRRACEPVETQRGEFVDVEVFVGDVDLGADIVAAAPGVPGGFAGGVVAGQADEFVEAAAAGGDGHVVGVEFSDGAGGAGEVVGDVVAVHMAAAIALFGGDLHHAPAAQGDFA